MIKCVSDIIKHPSTVSIMYTHIWISDLSITHALAAYQHALRRFHHIRIIIIPCTVYDLLFSLHTLYVLPVQTLLLSSSSMVHGCLSQSAKVLKVIIGSRLLSWDGRDSEWLHVSQSSHVTDNNASCVLVCAVCVHFTYSPLVWPWVLVMSCEIVLHGKNICECVCACDI